MASIYEVLSYGPIVAQDEDHGLLITVNGSYFNLWVQQSGGGNFAGNQPDQWENTDCRPLSNLGSEAKASERERVDARMAVKEAVQELERVGGRQAVMAKLEVTTDNLIEKFQKPQGLHGRSFDEVTEYAEQWLKGLTRICDCCGEMLQYRELTTVQDLCDNAGDGRYYAGFIINWAERYYCDEVSCVNEMLTTYDGDTVTDLAVQEVEGPGDADVVMPDSMLCYECDKIVPGNEYDEEQECCEDCRETTLQDLKDEYEAEKAGV